MRVSQVESQHCILSEQKLVNCDFFIDYTIELVCNTESSPVTSINN